MKGIEWNITEIKGIEWMSQRRREVNGT